MLDASNDLSALLEAKRIDARALLWTAELLTFLAPDGSVIARWTDADIPVTCNGKTYGLGPSITLGQITRQIGTQPSSMDVTLEYDDTVTINGVWLSTYIASNAFINSTLVYVRAYGATPGNVVGTLPRFVGRIAGLKDTGETSAQLTVTDNRDLLNVQVPPDQYQPPCLHLVFDEGCKLDVNDYRVDGVIQAGSNTLNLLTNFSGPDGDLNLGKITFTSGANSGLQRSIKVQGGGAIGLVRALPVAPAPGDKFWTQPGCDLTMVRCKDRFNNLAHYKGQPFIQTNETAAP